MRRLSRRTEKKFIFYVSLPPPYPSPLSFSLSFSFIPSSVCVGVSMCAGETVCGCLCVTEGVYTDALVYRCQRRALVLILQVSSIGFLRYDASLVGLAEKLQQASCLWIPSAQFISTTHVPGVLKLLMLEMEFGHHAYKSNT